MKNKLTEQDIDSLLEKSAIQFETKFGKCTVCYCKLPNGFTLVESTGAVSEDNYDESIGKKVCLEHIKDQLWKLEGYSLANELYKASK